MLLERAEALVQLNDGRINEAINIVNEIRNRAKQSTGAISNYQSDYGVRMNIMPYSGTYNQTEALNIVKDGTSSGDGNGVRTLLRPC